MCGFVSSGISFNIQTNINSTKNLLQSSLSFFFLGLETCWKKNKRHKKPKLDNDHKVLLQHPLPVITADKMTSENLKVIPGIVSKSLAT